MQDLTLLRGEAAELVQWRRHLSTAERVRIDKRNYELGLSLIEALPKQVGGPFPFTTASRSFT
jgi:hypothetical protein